MPDTLIIAVRSIMAFTALLLLTRAMGKQVISQLTFFEFVVGITIGDITASMAMDSNAVTFGEGFVAMLVFAGITILIGVIKLHSNAAALLIDGRPTQLVSNGKLLLENLKRERLSTEDVLAQLRLQQIFDIQEVEIAYLEINGQVSVKRRAQQGQNESS